MESSQAWSRFSAIRSCTRLMWMRSRWCQNSDSLRRRIHCFRCSGMRQPVRYTSRSWDRCSWRSWRRWSETDLALPSRTVRAEYHIRRRSQLRSWEWDILNRSDTTLKYICCLNLWRMAVVCALTAFAARMCWTRTGRD